jgi:hypothetical protein
VRITTSGITSAAAPGSTLRVMYSGPAAVVVLLGDRDVAAHDDAAQRALRLRVDQDARGHDLRDDAAELVGRAASEQHVVPVALGRQPAQFAAQEAAVELRRIGQTEVGVEAAGLLVPLGAQRAHGVAVAVPVDDLLLRARHAIRRVLERPAEVAERVVADVGGVGDGLDLEHGAAQVFEARAFVVAEPALRIAALVRGAIDVVGGNADGFLEDRDRERQVARGQCGDAGVEGGCGDGRAHDSSASRQAARFGTLPTAISAMMT